MYMSQRKRQLGHENYLFNFKQQSFKTRLLPINKIYFHHMNHTCHSLMKKIQILRYPLVYCLEFIVFILHNNNYNITIYYIPINVLSLDTVDFTECDPMLRITTLWFSESISPLSETDDVVHNVFLNTQCMRYCDVIHIAQ